MSNEQKQAADESAERERLEREVRRLEAELARMAQLLKAERAAFAAELALGVEELKARDERVEKLIRRRNKLTIERDDALRIAGPYLDSRFVRLSARVVSKARRLRGLA